MKNLLTILFVFASVTAFSQATGWKQLNLQKQMDFRVTKGANANNRQWRIAHNYSTQKALEFLRSTTDSTLDFVSDMILYEGTLGLGLNGSTPSALFHVKGGNLTGVRIESTGNAPILDFRYSLGVTANRNWRIGTNYNATGDLSVLYSATDGATPSVTAYSISSSGSMVIGTTTPLNDAAFEVAGSTKAFLPTRMTRTDFAGIVAKRAGLMTFGTTLNKMVYWDGTVTRVFLDSLTAEGLYRKVTDTATNTSSSSTIGQTQKRIDSLSSANRRAMWLPYQVTANTVREYGFNKLTNALDSVDIYTADLDTISGPTASATIGQLQKRIDSLSATLIKTGTVFFSGNGSSTTFDITLPTTPTWAQAESSSTDAANINYRSYITNGLRIHYAVAPPSGTNNLAITYAYK